jgi:ZIP family zinc transporter
VLAALLWGALAASSLVIGAWLGIAREWPTRLVGYVLGFGAGALISAVSFELWQEGVQRAGGTITVAIGLAVGALTYYFADEAIPDSGGGGALALGAFLDGIPEQMVLGLGLAGGEPVSIGLLAAVFVSNLPEAIGSSTAMRKAGQSNRKISRLWIAVAAICTLATVFGYVLGDSAGGDLRGAIDGFAAGALLVMLVDSMIPDATRQSGTKTGLVTTLGFAVAAGISLAS